MQFNLEKLEKNFMAVEVTNSPEEIETALSQAYKRVVNKVNLPGFRKGHIPRLVLEKNFGKEVLYEDALDIMVSEAYRQAIKEFNLEVIAQPQLDAKEALNPEQSFKFSIKMEVLPEIELGEYKGLEVEKIKVNVGDAQVEESLQAMRERNAEVVPSDKKVLENGDFAIIDFEGFLDGVPFPGGAGQAYTLEIGSGSFIPGFEEQLIGMEVETDKEIQVKFPEDYQSSDLAGKEVTFKVGLKEIKVKELPELDDEFAKSASKFQTLDELKADMKEKIIVNAEKEAENNYSQAVIDKAVDNAKVELPKTLVDRETEELIHRFEHTLAYQGVGLEQYLSYVNKTKDDLTEDMKPQAEKRVKTDLVLGAIAKAEKLEASEAELDERINELASYYQQKNVAKFKKELESKDRIEDIKQTIVLEKIADFIKESAVAKIIEK